jgi:hypothetical protein
MPLKKLPSKPQKNIKFLPISSYLSTIKDRVPQEWLIYIPESYKEITCQHTHTNV